jgi:Xaa-Pro dipeptidase
MTQPTHQSYDTQIDPDKVDPTTANPGAIPGRKPDNTPDDNDRIEIGPTPLAFDEWAGAGIECPDVQAMRAYRHNALIESIVDRDLGGLLLFDPLSIRYATDAPHMQLWNTHNPFRAYLILPDGHTVLYEYGGLAYLSEFNPLVREVRAGASMFYFATGVRTDEKAELFAHSVDELVREHSGTNRRLAVDKIQIHGLRALESAGFEILDGEEVTELTRVIKGVDEVKAMRCAVHACDEAIAAMREIAHPGVTESDVWAELHKQNIIRGGEWIETRILSTGPRTNPWFQECGPRVLQNNELLAFDTDLIGCYGMCADLSRTWFIGDGRPNDEQRRLHTAAYEHIQKNMEALKPGLTFRELSYLGDPLTEEFTALRYGSKYHGVGMCDEWPSIKYPIDFEERGYDGVLQPGMMLCVEAYIGVVGGRDGIKLEEQVLITEDGYENFSRAPFDDLLMS